MRFLLILKLTLLIGCVPGVKFESGSRTPEDYKRSMSRIDQDPILREIKELCFDLPVLRESQPTFAEIAKNGDGIFFGFERNETFEVVANKMRVDLVSKGWKELAEGPDLWEDQFTLVRESFKVHLAKLHSKRSSYVVSCRKISG